jgi:hypothetical protein
VRKVFGWKRFDSHEAVVAMNDLNANELRLLFNDFQANVKIVEKVRIGSRVVRRYGPPMTPLHRLIALELIDEQTAAGLIEHRKSLDPFALAAAIERKVAAIRNLPTSPIQPKKRAQGQVRLGHFFPRAAKRDADFQQAPVRSYVARR